LIPSFESLSIASSYFINNFHYVVAAGGIRK